MGGRDGSPSRPRAPFRESGRLGEATLPFPDPLLRTLYYFKLKTGVESNLCLA